MNNRHGETGRSPGAGEDLQECQSARVTAAERLKALEVAAGALVYDFDTASGTCWRSDGFELMLGWPPDDIAAGEAGLAPLRHPEDTKRLGTPHYAKNLKPDDHFVLEYRIRHRDGRYLWVLDQGRVFRNAVGDIARVMGALINIAGRKESEAQQRMMTRELAHRVKNSFAVLQSILRATLRASPDPQDFAEAFSGRLYSLAAAQDILTATDWKYAELGALARHQLSTIAVNEGDRLTISGPTVYLAAEHSVPLALIFNELATNAIKHGALSRAQGRIELHWHVTTNAAREDTLVLTWTEIGGPRIHAPRRQGFGSTLIEKSLVGAIVERRFDPGGLVCRIELPLTPVGGLSAAIQDGETT